MLNQKNKIFGLWSNEPIKCQQNIFDYIDVNFQVDSRVIYYLRNGRYYDRDDSDNDDVTNALAFSLGLCRSIFDREIDVGPTCIITDGVWIWNTILADYVAFNHVKIPDEFLRHIVENGYEIPDVTEDAASLIYKKYQYMIANNITEL
jgi:hypothetical protein